MQVNLGKNITLSVLPFTLADTPVLFSYLQQLSAITRSRFAPHGFESADILTAYASPCALFGYLGFLNNKELIAYTVVKIGYLQQDAPRLQSYGLSLHPLTDAAVAPSVADAWQGRGAGGAMMQAVIHDLKPKGINRLLLWGGVQTTNEKAVGFYKRMGFWEAGSFEYNGSNTDMVMELQ